MSFIAQELLSFSVQLNKVCLLVLKVKPTIIKFVLDEEQLHTLLDNLVDYEKNREKYSRLSLRSISVQTMSPIVLSKEVQTESSIMMNSFPASSTAGRQTHCLERTGKNISQTM